MLIDSPPSVPQLPKNQTHTVSTTNGLRSTRFGTSAWSNAGFYRSIHSAAVPDPYSSGFRYNDYCYGCGSFIYREQRP